ncbi:MAG TPA: efflux transporter periplasmic adaptor subunit, partial [Flavobacteriia bacterium]|nr:efflux transporter periplasmic adaptor subunit [Flavobacteriia bacterium]
MKHIYIILISLALIACEESENQSKTTTKEQLPSNGIVVTKAQFNTEKMQLGMLTEQWFNTKVKATGFIDVPPQNKSSVSTFMGGYIVKTPLLIGDKVKKGQLLISLENTDFVEIQQQYLEVAE